MAHTQHTLAVAQGRANMTKDHVSPRVGSRVQPQVSPGSGRLTSLMPLSPSRKGSQWGGGGACTTATATPASALLPGIDRWAAALLRREQAHTGVLPGRAILGVGWQPSPAPCAAREAACHTCTTPAPSGMATGVMVLACSAASAAARSARALSAARRSAFRRSRSFSLRRRAIWTCSSDSGAGACRFAACGCTGEQQARQTPVNRQANRGWTRWQRVNISVLLPGKHAAGCCAVVLL